MFKCLNARLHSVDKMNMCFAGKRVLDANIGRKSKQMSYICIQIISRSSYIIHVYYYIYYILYSRTFAGAVYIHI